MSETQVLTEADVEKAATRYTRIVHYAISNAGESADLRDMKADLLEVGGKWLADNPDGTYIQLSCFIGMYVKDQWCGGGFLSTPKWY